MSSVCSRASLTLVDQYALINFPCFGSGHGFTKFNMRRHHEILEMPGTMTQHFLRRELCAFSQRDYRLNRLAKDWIRSTDHYRHIDSFQPIQDILNFFGANLFSAAFD